VSFSRVFCLLAARVGSVSRLSDILSQMISTSRSNVCLTLMLSLALVSKNSNPKKTNNTFIFDVYSKISNKYTDFSWARMSGETLRKQTCESRHIKG